MLAETRAFNEGLERILLALPPVHTLDAEATRRARRADGGIFPAPVYLPEARWERIPGRGGEIPLRIVEPAGEPRGAYLHFHGGGWTLGAADLQDPALKAAADATGLVMVSVDYRLAPEHPYPAAPDDCEDAARWFLETYHGRRGDRRRVGRRAAVGRDAAASARPMGNRTTRGVRRRQPRSSGRST